MWWCDTSYPSQHSIQQSHTLYTCPTHITLDLHTIHLYHCQCTCQPPYIYPTIITPVSNSIHLSQTFFLSEDKHTCPTLSICTSLLKHLTLLTCLTLPKDHQVLWEYINVCGYSDQFCTTDHILHSYGRTYVQNEWSHSLFLNNVQARQQCSGETKMQVC